MGTRVVPFAEKVLSDGASIDDAGNLYLTDVEHAGVARLSPDRKLQTMELKSGVQILRARGPQSPDRPEPAWRAGLVGGVVITVPGGQCVFLDADLHGHHGCGKRQEGCGEHRGAPEEHADGKAEHADENRVARDCEQAARDECAGTFGRHADTP